MSLIQRRTITEDELKQLQNGREVQIRTTHGVLQVAVADCEDGHMWGVPTVEDGVLTRECEVCNATERMITEAEYIMESYETRVDADTWTG